MLVVGWGEAGVHGVGMRVRIAGGGGDPVAQYPPPPTL